MAIWHWIRRIPRTELSISAGAFLVLAGLTHFAISKEQELLEANLRARVSESAMKAVSRLDAELNANVFLANGMAAYVMAQGGIVDAAMPDVLRALYRNGRHLRSIGIAPHNRISHVYPLEGNQAAIGLYYPDVPLQWGAVKRAMESRTTVLAGPVPLRQGGNGLISRTPVFLADGTYWGIVSLVLDADALLKAVGLADTDEVSFAIRGRDGEGQAGEVFFGDPALFNEASIRVPLPIPGGSWELAALPGKGWNVTFHRALWLEACGLAASLLAAMILYGYQHGRRRIVDSERRLRAFLETTRDAVIVIDAHGIIQEFNPAAEAMFGYQASEMLGNSVKRLMSAEDAERHDQYLSAPKGGDPRHMAKGREVFGRRRTGEIFPIEVTVGQALVGGTRLHVGVVRDISERKAFGRRLLELAMMDGLTGILNRRAFVEAAASAFSLARRHGRPLSFLMFDADHFKRVNDTYGHHVGDAVLIKMSQVVQDALRAGDVLGRIGGEEFGILLPETSLEQAAEVAERLIGAIRQASVETEEGRLVRFTISAGIAAVTPDVPDLDALMRQADGALYEAKQSGRDRWSAAQGACHTVRPMK
jgi:diguanylate cyclase (GGDEF)-like protein/PAS domain S-box-containing protein